MRANEFIKKFGWDKAKEAIKNVAWCETAYCLMLKHGCFKSNSDCCVDIKDLKRLIESHELVENCGGLQAVGEKLTHGLYESRAVIERLKKAIADVESCQ